jgi:hypothetical protein
MLSSLVIRVIYIFNVNVDVTDIHADHFLDGARNILLDIAAYLADIYILLEDEMQIHVNGIFFRFNANPVACSSFKESIHAPRDGSESAYAGYAQCGKTGNGCEYVR